MPRTILLIDDEESVRELVQACLSDLAGWHVITAASAQAGLEQLATQRPDVILLDVLMPGMDAITFLERLQGSPSTASVPVLLLTVEAHWFTSQRLQQLGIVTAISKPFDPVTLSNTIAVALKWKI